MRWPVLDSMAQFVASHLFHIFIFLLLLSFFVPLLRRFAGPRSGKGRSHVRLVVDYVQKRGYTLLNPAIAQNVDRSLLEMMRDPALRKSVRATADLTDIPEMERGDDDWLAFTCDIRSRQVTIFNLSTTPPLGSDTGPVAYKVAKIRAAGLPRFSLQKRSAVTLVEGMVEKLTHQPDSSVALDPALHPNFAGHYQLRGSDTATIRDFFSPSRIGFIETEKLEGTLTSNGECLVYFEYKAMQTEQDYDTFIARIEKIVANILNQ